MLGGLTYVAIAALTRNRLDAIEQRLLAKIKSGQNVSDLERQVHFLALKARDSISLPPHLPTESNLPPFARELSRYSVLGSSGPSIPQFAAMFAPGQAWLVDTLRGGNPDPNRERVLAGSTDFLLELASRGTALINASDVAEKAIELKRLHAYILGHACHIAADVVSAPFVNAIAWQLGTPTRAQLTPEQVADAIEQATAQLFRRDLADVAKTPTLAARGDLYKDWWLPPKALPAKFFEAFKYALEATYGPGASPILRPQAAGVVGRSPQVSAQFWKQFQNDKPPDLSVRLLEDSYASFVSVMETDYAWNRWDWLAATFWIFVPPIAAYPLIVSMPHTRALFKDGALVDGKAVDTDLGWFGLVMAPLITSSLAPVVLSVYIAAFTSFGVSRQSVLGWIAGGANLITSLLALAAIRGEASAFVRWVLLLMIPVGGLLGHAKYVLDRRGSNPRHTQLAMGSLLPCIITAVYVLFHIAVHRSQDWGMNGWLEDDNGEPAGWDSGRFIGAGALWAAIMLVAWYFVSGKLVRGNQFVDGQKHILRLFGHSTLFSDPNLAADVNNPSLAAHYFPTGRRPLLKLWWAGTGDLFMRSDRNTLLFSTTADGTGNPQAILAPAAPMKASEFASFLNQAVKEGVNFSTNLKTALVDPLDFDSVLPPGEVFADAGDEEKTVAAHADKEKHFVKLKTTQDNPSVLFHAPRSHLAGHQGQRGPVFVDTDRALEIAGSGQITFPDGNVSGDGNTRFTTFFQPGDVIATVGVAAGDQSRIVAAVQDDANLTVTQPFTFPALVAMVPRNYQRGINTRDTDTPSGTLQDTTTFRVYQGANFERTFMVGDTLRALSITPPVLGAGRAVCVGTAVTGTPATRFTALFRIGDIIGTLGPAPNEFRVVTAIADDQTMTVNFPFTLAVAGAGRTYYRFEAVEGRGAATFAGAIVRGDDDTRFATDFKRGDLITTVGSANIEEARLVESVLNDATLTVTSPFTGAVGGAPLKYLRMVAGVDAQRTVVAVSSATQLTLDKPLDLPLLPGALATEAVCWRVGRLTSEGFGYTPVSPVGVFAGDSLLERAADLGAILCMGATTHMLSAADRQAIAGDDENDEKRRPAINPVYQVFRNWNLNQRRLNEWNMLIAGGAVSEKRGAPDKADPLQPGIPAGWSAPTPTGESVANGLGWLPLMHKWLDVAQRPGVSSMADDAFREGDPTNKRLSEGIAFLFDLPMPV